MSKRQEIRDSRRRKAAALADLAELAEAVDQYRVRIGRAKVGTNLLAPVSYNTVHQRLRSTRGPASRYQCTHCPEVAADWAYDHSDPNELLDAKGSPYSLELDRYRPLCRPCHRRDDVKI